jgi:hypothetical protein
MMGSYSQHNILGFEKEMSYKNTLLIYIKQQKAAMICQNNMYNTNNHKRCIRTADKK